MESPAEISFSSLKALIAPQQHLSTLGGKTNECHRGRGARYKSSLYFLSGCFGQFGFLLLYFTTVSSNPDSVFRTLLKSYFYNTAVAITREAFCSQRQLMLALLLSLFSSPALCWEDFLGNHFSLGLSPAFLPPNSS